jgi:uncharacterized damage-inducible protein DinB
MHDLLTRLEGQHRFLTEIAEFADQTQTPEGAWTATQTLAHLARYHSVLLQRIDLILSGDRPAMPRYKAETDEAWPQWRDAPLTQSLQEIARQRARLRERLEALTTEQWSRVGVHPVIGPMTLASWLEFFLVHEAHHLYTLLVRRRLQ